MNKKAVDMTCPFCKYHWETRPKALKPGKLPKECPRCKRRIDMILKYREDSRSPAR